MGYLGESAKAVAGIKVDWGRAGMEIVEDRLKEDKSQVSRWQARVVVLCSRSPLNSISTYFLCKQALLLSECVQVQDYVCRGNAQPLNLRATSQI